MASYIKKKSKKQEDKTAKEFSGRCTPASGSLDNAKGDVKTDIFLIENKYTEKDKYKLDITTWSKIEKEAIREGLRTPMLQVDIQDLSLVIMDWNDFPEFLPPSYVIFSSCAITSSKSFILKREDLEQLRDVGRFFTIEFTEKRLGIMEKSNFLEFLD